MFLSLINLNPRFLIVEIQQAVSPCNGFSHFLGDRELIFFPYLYTNPHIHAFIHSGGMMLFKKWY
jgi:hypothetical protein